MKQTIQLVEADQIIRLPFEFCIQCGSKGGISHYPFDQIENNPVAQFAGLVGDVGVIADYVLNKPHKVEAPFCARCFAKFKSVGPSRQVFGLIFVTVIFVTILVSTYVNSIAGFSNSGLALLAGICLAIFVRIYARYYAWKNSPNIKSVSKKKIVLKVPGHGKFICHR